MGTTLQNEDVKSNIKSARSTFGLVLVRGLPVGSLSTTPKRRPSVFICLRLPGKIKRKHVQ